MVKVTQADRDAVDAYGAEVRYAPESRDSDGSILAEHFAHHRQSSIAELCEGLRRIEEMVFPHPNSSHVYVDSIRAECRALLSKHQFHRDGEEPNKTSPVNK